MVCLPAPSPIHRQGKGRELVFLGCESPLSKVPQPFSCIFHEVVIIQVLDARTEVTSQEGGGAPRPHSVPLGCQRLKAGGGHGLIQRKHAQPQKHKHSCLDRIPQRPAEGNAAAPRNGPLTGSLGLSAPVIRHGPRGIAVSAAICRRGKLGGLPNGGMFGCVLLSPQDNRRTLSRAPSGNLVRNGPRTSRKCA